MVGVGRKPWTKLAGCWLVGAARRQLLVLMGEMMVKLPMVRETGWKVVGHVMGKLPMVRETGRELLVGLIPKGSHVNGG